MGVGRALLIGCNYEESPRAELYGCINDVLDEFYFLTSLLAFKVRPLSTPAGHKCAIGLDAVSLMYPLMPSA